MFIYEIAQFSENTLGYEGIWLVSQSRDYFRPFIADLEDQENSQFGIGA